MLYGSFRRNNASAHQGCALTDQGHLLEQVRPCRSGVGWGRRNRGTGWGEWCIGQEEGWFGGSGACRIITLFSGSIYLHSSTQICVSFIAGGGWVGNKFWGKGTHSLSLPLPHSLQGTFGLWRPPWCVCNDGNNNNTLFLWKWNITRK